MENSRADSLDLKQIHSQFKTDHLVRQITLRGYRWEFIDSGIGDPLILLPGFFGIAGTDFLYILDLQKFFRTISITYPENIQTIDGLVTGLRDLINALNLSAVNILGGSYSGYIAQVLLWKHPGVVKNIILAQTGLPQRNKVPLAVSLSWIFQFLPLVVLRRFMLVINAFYYPANNPENKFWRGYFNALINTFSHQALVNRFRVVEDYHARHHSSFYDLSSWRGSILILEAAEDEMLSHQDRIELKHKYPIAQIQKISGNHTKSVYNPADQILAIKEFLQQCRLNSIEVKNPEVLGG